VVFLILGVTWLASTMGDGLELFRTKPDPMLVFLKTITVMLLGVGIVVLSLNAIS
jgi:hypothetical protein